MTSAKPGSSSGKRWSVISKAKLRQIYETYPRVDIMKAFPGRTWGSIHHQAFAMGLRRKVKYMRPCTKPTRHPIMRALREERVRQGLSLNALGKRAGYSGEHIGEWERGVYAPLMPSIADLANALGLELTVKRMGAQ